MIGQKLAHFEIAAKLGEGGMGEVYLAQDTKLGRQVAIKVLPEAFVADAERLARFEREAKVLATLNHPNIAGIYEIGEAESVHFLVMELVEGQDLASRISHGPLPSEEALSLAQQIAEALATAHGKGIVHRDLKPANVMIDPDGRAKVLDFGLAKALDDAPETEAALSMSVDPVVFTFYEPHPITGRDILIMRPGEDPVTLVATPGHDKAPRLSADARYLSYVTDTSGSSEVYVRTCPPCRPDLDLDEQSWRISLNGGTAPVWSRDGDEIFYLEGQKMMAVPVRTEPDFIAEAPELLFEGTYLPEQFGNANYDVSPDGRFIMIKSGGSEASRHRMNVVVNWFQEFGD